MVLCGTKNGSSIYGIAWRTFWSTFIFKSGRSRWFCADRDSSVLTLTAGRRETELSLSDRSVSPPAGRQTEIKALFDKHRAAVYFYLRLASSHWFSAAVVSLAVVHTKRHFRWRILYLLRAVCGVEQEPRVEIRLQGPVRDALHHHNPTSLFLQRSEKPHTRLLLSWKHCSAFTLWWTCLFLMRRAKCFLTISFQ